MTVFKHDIKVYIPFDYEFNYKECKKLFKRSKKTLEENREFREVVKNDFFYSFFTKNDEFIGCIYLHFEENNKLFLSGFANRHKSTVECMKMIPDWFTCDIYAKSKFKPAIYTLLKAGFKKIGTEKNYNIYKYERI